MLIKFNAQYQKRTMKMVRRHGRWCHIPTSFIKHHYVTNLIVFLVFIWKLCCKTFSVPYGWTGSSICGACERMKCGGRSSMESSSQHISKCCFDTLYLLGSAALPGRAIGCGVSGLIAKAIIARATCQCVRSLASFVRSSPKELNK